jgi:hypothetical protein
MVKERTYRIIDEWLKRAALELARDAIRELDPAKRRAMLEQAWLSWSAAHGRHPDARHR